MSLIKFKDVKIQKTEELWVLDEFCKKFHFFRTMPLEFATCGDFY